MLKILLWKYAQDIHEKEDKTIYSIFFKNKCLSILTCTSKPVNIPKPS